MSEPIVFVSSHYGTERTYRVHDGAPSFKLAHVEYLSGGKWRPVRSTKTRDIAHVLVHGEPHGALSAKAGREVAKLARKCRIK